MNEQNPQNEKGKRTKAESTIFWRGRRPEGLANPTGPGINIPRMKREKRTKAESTIFWRGRRLEGLANPAGSKRSGAEVERHGGELRGGTILEEEHGVGVGHHEERA